MNDHRFCRLYLKEVMRDVREHTTPEQRKAAWAWKCDRTVEFHGPDGYYWYGSECCLWAARASGWTAWMDHRTEPPIGAGG